MNLNHEKTILDTKGHPHIYYDGDSMGGGHIIFSCGFCGKEISKETFYFYEENIDQESSIIKSLAQHLDLPQKHQRHNTFVGLLTCQACNSKHVLHIDYGEVSNGHWQSVLHKILLCNS